MSWKKQKQRRISNFFCSWNKQTEKLFPFATEERLNYGAAENFSVHYFLFSVAIVTLSPFYVKLKLILIKTQFHNDHRAREMFKRMTEEL